MEVETSFEAINQITMNSDYYCSHDLNNCIAV
jgi:hypothetical protein